MNAKKSVPIGLSLLAVVAIGGAWHCIHSIRSDRIALAAIASQRAIANAEIRRLERRLQLAGKTGSGSPSVASPADSAPKTARPSGIEMLKEFQDELKDPKLQLLELSASRAKAVVAYARLFHALGLNSIQIEKFLANVAKHDEKIMDLSGLIGSIAQSGKVTSDTGRTLAEFQGQADTEYQAAQKELLAEAGFQQLQAYERLLPAQNIASSLAGAAVLAGTPLTVDQAEQLTQVLANASKNYQDGQAADLWSINWDAVDAQAQPILSESQLNLLKTTDLPGDSGRFWIRFDHAYNAAKRADKSHPPATENTPAG